MGNTKKIICIECGEPIQFKNDLIISPKILQPYHHDCFMNPDKFVGKLNKFYGPFPLRSRFWLWLIIGNILAGIICIIEKNPSTLLYAFIALCDIIFISARVGIYYAYERHLN